MIQIKRPCRYLKGDLYYVLDVVKNCQNSEEFVVYQALYALYKIYSRKLVEFSCNVLSREDNVTGQVFKFELVDSRKLL